MLTTISRVYTVKNAEVAWVAEFAFRCMVNTLKEQSSGLSVGFTTHALERQTQFLAAIRARLAATDHPIPDLPVTHPVPLECDFSGIPPVLTDDSGRPVSSDCVHVATAWGQVFAELCGSNSAGIAGGVLSFDLRRAENNILAVEQLIAAIAASSDVDFPETAAPGATEQPLRKGAAAARTGIGR